MTVASLIGAAGASGTSANRNSPIPLRTLPASLNASSYTLKVLDVSVEGKVIIARVTWGSKSVPSYIEIASVFPESLKTLYLSIGQPLVAFGAIHSTVKLV